MTNFYDEIFIISINDGEDEQNIVDEEMARQLYNDLIADPAEDYRNIKLIKYTYETREETVLDSHTFAGLEEALPDNLELVKTVDSLPIVEVEPDKVEVDYSCYTTLVYTLQAVANDMKYIHWNCCGKDFDCIHTLTEEYYNKLNEQLDTVAEMALEEPGVTLPNPSNMANKLDWPCIDNTRNISTVDAWRYIEGLILSILNTTKQVKCNFTDDIQSELDSIIRYWTKELKYKIARRLEAD